MDTMTLNILVVIAVVFLAIQPSMAGKVLAVGIVTADIILFGGTVFTIVICLGIVCWFLRILLGIVGVM